jgi:hypothetical protein
MDRRELLGILGVSATGMTASGLVLAQDKPGRASPATGPQHHDIKMLQSCLKACSDCMDVCNITAHYCIEQTENGKRELAKALRATVDCQEFCAISAKLLGRVSPMMAFSCDACAKACDACATVCEQAQGDKQLLACAESCRSCAKSCREMVKAMHYHEKPGERPK